VRAGITTMRDLGGVLETVVARRDAIRASNDPSLPRLVVAGPIMNVLGSYSTEIYGISDEIAIVSGPEDAQAEVNRILDGGADLIKLAVSGRTDVNYAELSEAELSAIIEAAHGRGVHVAAHVDRASALRRAVAAGIDSAVHSPRDRIPDDLIAQMVEQQVGLIPTIAVYEGLARERGNLADWRRSIQPVMYDNLRRFVAAGGLLAFGDDYGGAPGMTLGMPIEEINHWMAAGLSPMQIIVAATRDAATMLGLEQELGQVKVGYQADLLIVAGDPLQEISALNQPTLVIHAGQIIEP
jgi:imidazolonepropionase-like amidohydrolase